MYDDIYQTIPSKSNVQPDDIYVSIPSKQTVQRKQEQIYNLDDKFVAILKLYNIETICATALLNDLHKAKKICDKYIALFSRDVQNLTNELKLLVPQTPLDKIVEYGGLFGSPISESQFKLIGGGLACTTLSLSIAHELALIWKESKCNYDNFKSAIPKRNWDLATKRGVNAYKTWKSKHAYSYMPHAGELTSDVCKIHFNTLIIEDDVYNNRISENNIKETLDALIERAIKANDCIGISFTHSNSTWCMVVFPFVNNMRTISEYKLRLAIYDSHGAIVPGEAYLAFFEVFKNAKNDKVCKYIHKVLTSGNNFEKESDIIKKYGKDHDIMEIAPTVSYSAIYLLWK